MNCFLEGEYITRLYVRFQPEEREEVLTTPPPSLGTPMKGGNIY
jgi:hypothetical protein